MDPTTWRQHSGGGGSAPQHPFGLSWWPGRSGGVSSSHHSLGVQAPPLAVPPGPLPGWDRLVDAEDACQGVVVELPFSPGAAVAYACDRIRQIGGLLLRAGESWYADQLDQLAQQLEHEYSLPPPGQGGA